MSEVPTSPQFIGKADATREVGKPTEFTLSSEQQKIADTMKQNGETLEKSVIDARQKAGDQLKQLHGKELVRAGLRQMGHGVWETVKAKIKWGLGLGIAGGVVGNFGGDRSRAAIRSMLYTFFPDYGSASEASEGAVLGILTGGVVGLETAGITYNRKIAAKKNLPTTKWYDWAISNTGLLSLEMLTRGKEIGMVADISRVMFNTFFNPISVGGLRTALYGLWKTGKGQ